MGCGGLSESKASIRIYAFLEKRGNCDGGFSSLLGSWVRIHMEHRDVVYKACYMGPISSMPFKELVDTVTWETFYYPVNLTFATKMFGCVFAIAVYAIHFLARLEKRGK